MPPETENSSTDDVRRRFHIPAPSRESQQEAVLQETGIPDPLCPYWDGEHCWSLLADPGHACTCKRAKKG